MHLVARIEKVLESKLDPDSLNSISNYSDRDLARFYKRCADEFLENRDNFHEHGDHNEIRPFIPYPSYRIRDFLTPKEDRITGIMGAWQSIYPRPDSGDPYVASDKLKYILLYAHGATLVNLLFSKAAFAQQSKWQIETLRNILPATINFLKFVHDISPLISSGIVDFALPALNFGIFSPEIEPRLLEKYAQAEELSSEDDHFMQHLQDAALRLRPENYSDKKIAQEVARARRMMRERILISAINDIEAQVSTSLIIGRRTLLLASPYHEQAINLLRENMLVDKPNQDARIQHNGAYENFRRGLLQANPDVQGILEINFEQRRLHKLIQVDIPKIDRLSMHDIVAIRQSSDAFNDWRSGLRRSLDEVESGAEFTMIAKENLGHLARKASVDLRSTPLRERVYSEVRSFSIGLIPALIATSDIRSAAILSLAYRSIAGIAVPSKLKKSKHSDASAIPHHYMAITGEAI